MIVRIGKVTNVYPDKGRVKVYYKDRESTSIELPLLTFGEKYVMPKVGNRVLTVHMENGTSKGFVLGTYWVGTHTPKEAGEGLFRQEYGEDAFARYKEGELRLCSPEIVFQCDAGGVSVEAVLALIERVNDLENRVSALERE